MINFDYFTLRAFLNENSNFFIGAKIQKIQQPSRKELIVTLRNQSVSKKLYVTVNPKFYHLAFLNEETYKNRNINIPQKPPMFCMLLRKHIDNALIKKISIPPYERIFEIHLDTFNELGEPKELCLTLELMGKHSNIILYNKKTRIIIGSIHNIGPEKSKDREIRGGLPYIYPPLYKSKQDILRYFGEINYKTMSDDFLGISKSFSELCKKNNLSLEKIKDYTEGTVKISPAIDGETYSIYSELLSNPVLQKNVNDMIDNYYSNEQKNEYVISLKRKLETNLKHKIKKLKNTIEKIKSELNKENCCEVFKHYGDLIMNNLYMGKDYTDFITVFDYEKNRDLRIELDITKTLKENAVKFYDKYKHSKSTKTKLEEILSLNIQEKLYCEEFLYGLSLTNDIESLKELELESESDLGLKSNPKENITKPYLKNKSHPTITEEKVNGFKVYIGNNSIQNNYIITRLAKDEDIWFHVKNYPGSHIVLKIPDKIIPSKEVILKCCELAKEHSVGKTPSKIAVIYTKKKNLKHPPKTHLGYVTYKNETEVLI